MDGELSLGRGGCRRLQLRRCARGGRGRGGAAGRAPAAQTPRHSGSMSLAWRGDDGASALVAARYAGEQYEDDLNAQELPDAVTIDCGGAWPLART
jgi:hypothetical protein